VNEGITVSALLGKVIVCPRLFMKMTTNFELSALVVNREEMQVNSGEM